MSGYEPIDSYSYIRANTMVTNSYKAALAELFEIAWNAFLNNEVDYLIDDKEQFCEWAKEEFEKNGNLFNRFYLGVVNTIVIYEDEEV